MSVYIEGEGVQFGLAVKARVWKDYDPVGSDRDVLHLVDGVFARTRCRLWGLCNGYGWIEVRS